MHVTPVLHIFYIIAVKGFSFVYLKNCIFCPLSLSVMFIVYALQLVKTPNTSAAE